MSANTDIHWCDSSLNLEMGCDGCELWHPSRGVRRCYAGVMTGKVLAHGPVRGWPTSFDRPKLFPERMAEAESWSDLTHTARENKPWLDDLPRLIFLNDMGDTFSQRLPIDWMAPLLPRMARTPHIYLLLTKRVRMMREFFERHECPPNMGCGASITDTDKLFPRISALANVRCAWRFVSCEPLWSSLNLRPWLADRSISWVILGGESGPDAKFCDLTWIRRCIEDCRQHDVPVFVKQLGARPYVSPPQEDSAPPSRTQGPMRSAPEIRLRDRHGGDWSEWPADMRVRQMPTQCASTRPRQLELVSA